MADTSAAAAPAPASDRIDGPLVRLMVVLLVGGIMGLLDTTIVNVGVDTLTRDLHTSLKLIEWVTTAYLLALAATVPFSGWAVERFGGKTVWLTGLVVFLAGSALSSAAWDVGSLIGFRTLQGIGAGMLEPTLLTLIARAAGPARAGKMSGIYGVAVTLGPIFGPVIGGVVIGNVNWRWMFLINIPVGLLAIALAVRYVPADRPEPGTARRLDIVGISLLAPAFVALVFGLSQAAGGTGFGAPQVITGLALGAALLVAYLLYALRASAPVVDVRLFTGRGFAGGIMAVFLTGFLLFSLLLLVPLYYQDLRGRGVVEAGLLLGFQGLGGWLGMPVAGVLFDRMGGRLLMVIGAVVTALGIAGFAFLGAATAIGVLVAASLVTGFGLGMIGALAMSSSYGSVPEASVPSATATVYLANQVGGSLGIAVAALVLEDLRRSQTLLSAFHGTFGYLIAVSLLAVIAGLILPRFQPAAAAAEDTRAAVPAAADAR